MKNTRHIAWLILLVLFSQQTLASARMIINMSQSDNETASLAYTNHVGHHQGDSSQPAQHSTPLSHSSMSNPITESTPPLLAHKDKHGTQCEHCISGCQTIAFFHTGFQALTHSRMIEITHYNDFVPFAPLHNLYRPPIITPLV
jgi:hypothetical protein